MLENLMNKLVCWIINHYHLYRPTVYEVLWKISPADLKQMTEEILKAKSNPFIRKATTAGECWKRQSLYLESVQTYKTMNKKESNQNDS